jgi:hypothetical protein
MKCVGNVAKGAYGRGQWVVGVRLRALRLFLVVRVFNFIFDSLPRLRGGEEMIAM